MLMDKFQSFYTETQNGKRMDILEDLTESYPCITAVVLTFTADGEIVLKDDQCRGTLRDSGIGNKWKSVTKKKTTVLLEDRHTDPVTYDFEIVGNKMRWTMGFSSDIEKDNGDIIKLLVVEFVKA